jgi:hypothetical protein
MPNISSIIGSPVIGNIKAGGALPIVEVAAQQSQQGGQGVSAAWKPDFTQANPYAGMTQQYSNLEATLFKPTVTNPIVPSAATTITPTTMQTTTPTIISGVNTPAPIVPIAPPITVVPPSITTAKAAINPPSIATPTTPQTVTVATPATATPASAATVIKGVTLTGNITTDMNNLMKADASQTDIAAYLKSGYANNMAINVLPPSQQTVVKTAFSDIKNNPQNYMTINGQFMAIADFNALPKDKQISMLNTAGLLPAGATDVKIADGSLSYKTTIGQSTIPADTYATYLQNKAGYDKLGKPAPLHFDETTVGQVTVIPYADPSKAVTYSEPQGTNLVFKNIGGVPTLDRLVDSKNQQTIIQFTDNTFKVDDVIQAVKAGRLTKDAATKLGVNVDTQQQQVVNGANVANSLIDWQSYGQSLNLYQKDVFNKAGGGVQGYLKVQAAQQNAIAALSPYFVQGIDSGYVAEHGGMITKDGYNLKAAHNAGIPEITMLTAGFSPDIINSVLSTNESALVRPDYISPLSPNVSSQIAKDLTGGKVTTKDLAGGLFLDVHDTAKLAGKAAQAVGSEAISVIKGQPQLVGQTGSLSGMQPVESSVRQADAIKAVADATAKLAMLTPDLQNVVASKLPMQDKGIKGGLSRAAVAETGVTADILNQLTFGSLLGVLQLAVNPSGAITGIGQQIAAVPSLLNVSGKAITKGNVPMDTLTSSLSSLGIDAFVVGTSLYQLSDVVKGGIKYIGEIQKGNIVNPLTGELLGKYRYSSIDKYPVVGVPIEQPPEVANMPDYATKNIAPYSKKFGGVPDTVNPADMDYTQKIVNATTKGIDPTTVNVDKDMVIQQTVRPKTAIQLAGGDTAQIITSASRDEIASLGATQAKEAMGVGTLAKGELIDINGELVRVKGSDLQGVLDNPIVEKPPWKSSIATDASGKPIVYTLNPEAPPQSVTGGIADGGINPNPTQKMLDTYKSMSAADKAAIADAQARQTAIYDQSLKGYKPTSNVLVGVATDVKPMTAGTVQQLMDTTNPTTSARSLAREIEAYNSRTASPADKLAVVSPETLQVGSAVALMAATQALNMQVPQSLVAPLVQTTVANALVSGIYPTVKLLPIDSLKLSTQTQNVVQLLSNLGIQTAQSMMAGTLVDSLSSSPNVMPSVQAQGKTNQQIGQLINTDGGSQLVSGLNQLLQNNMISVPMANRIINSVFVKTDNRPAIQLPPQSGITSLLKGLNLWTIDPDTGEIKEARTSEELNKKAGVAGYPQVEELPEWLDESEFSRLRELGLTDAEIYEILRKSMGDKRIFDWLVNVAVETIKKDIDKAEILDKLIREEQEKKRFEETKAGKEVKEIQESKAKEEVSEIKAPEIYVAKSAWDKAIGSQRNIKTNSFDLGSALGHEMEREADTLTFIKIRWEQGVPIVTTWKVAMPALISGAIKDAELENVKDKEYSTELQRQAAERLQNKLSSVADVSELNRVLNNNDTKNKYDTRLNNALVNKLNNQLKEQTQTKTQTQTETQTQTQQQTKLQQQLQQMLQQQLQTQTETQTQTQQQTQTQTQLQTQQPPKPPTTKPPKDKDKDKIVIVGKDSQSTDDKRREKFAGSLGWKQGFGYYAIKHPYTKTSDIAFFKVPPDGFKLVQGANTAYRTIQQITGKPPTKEIKVNMGIVNVHISKPSYKAGDKGAIKFQQNRRAVRGNRAGLVGIRS